MNNNKDMFLPMFLIFCGIGVLIGTILLSINSKSIEDKLEKLQKQAITYDYATYDENGEFVWIIPDEKKE